MATPRRAIPAERVERNPLITPEGYDRLVSILQDPDAPAWNYAVGDRVQADDLQAVEGFRRGLRSRRRRGTGRPPREVLDALVERRTGSRLLEERVPPGIDLERRWHEVPTMGREDLARRPEDLVPIGSDLSRMIVYDTSGTTGHAIRVPQHPRTVAMNHPLLEWTLGRFGVRPTFGPDVVACLNVGAQLTTVVFANVFAVWNDAGFAKVNLHPRVWSPEAARRFFERQRPVFLTGDPIGFAELLRWEIDLRPAALVSTAVALSPGLRSELEKRYRCPVIDTYATTETGPIAYSSPDLPGMHVLPPDLHVEAVDEEGRPVPEGERGEICVTGGRNPYLPLLRYRTGDFGRLVWSETAKGDPAPRILDLEGRKPIEFRASDGSAIGPVDIGRIIRLRAVVQHEFVQRADGSCELTLRPAPGCPVDTEALGAELEGLFGAGARISIRLDDRLGSEGPRRKVVPFRSEASRGAPAPPAGPRRGRPSPRAEPERPSRSGSSRGKSGRRRRGGREPGGG